jgi:nanoRNase/pAp phosphatase (c-di-AMP/oligoRNAs hydrolase)
MTAFIESCVETVAGSAAATERGHRHRPRAHRLIRVLRDRKNILVTTHRYPDPDALASSLALAQLLRAKLPDARIEVSIKGSLGGGYNAAFARQADLRTVPWDDAALHDYDAILLLDVQPSFKFNPLPDGMLPTAVIDHHRARGRRANYAFCDIRPDVGASSSIVFSYFMELEVDIPPDLAAALLFAIETDLSGAAGQPGDLDNMALASLTLLADTRKLYKMRYADLPQSIYIAYADGLANAIYFAGSDGALMSHLDNIYSPEMPAIIADFLLRFDMVNWVLVTAVNEKNLCMSLRTSGSRSAADVMRRLLRGLGEGGGHRTKAGGTVTLESGSPAEVERIRKVLRRRLLRSLKIPVARGQRLVPKEV